MVTSPLRTKLQQGIVRSGMVQLNSGHLMYTKLAGYDWSPTAKALSSAVNIDFNWSHINSSAGPNSRWAGFPVRCLASGA